jgi:hypothetical protein
LNAVVNYAGKSETFCSIVNEIDRGDASSIGILQEIVRDSNDEACIHVNLSYLLQSIMKLENYITAVRNNKINPQYSTSGRATFFLCLNN